MTLYEREQAENRQEWKEEGEKIGEQKTIIETVKNFLKENITDYEKVAKFVPNLTIELFNKAYAEYHNL